MRVPASGSLRVRTDRVDRLIETVGELVIAHSLVVQDRRVLDAGPDLARKVGHADKVLGELQDLALAMRMVPLRPTFQKMARLVRDLAHKSGKAVGLVVEGEDTEIDRTVVDVLADPLVHLVRNAVDHGLEPPEVRERLGKPRTGTVRLRACHAGGSVVVEVHDDGRGLDGDEIARQAAAKGVIEPGKELGGGDALALIFLPGFSTAERVTDVSGRGVGLDVVKRAIEGLRGSIEVASARGSGCTFTLRLPLTLALTDGMVVRAGDERYVIPTEGIVRSFRPEPGQLSTVAGRGELVVLRGQVLAVYRLHRLFGVAGAVEDAARGLLVVLADGSGAGGDHRAGYALLVDEVVGQLQVVAKPLGGFLGRTEGVTGAAILGDGRVGLMLDPLEVGNLARRAPRRERDGEEIMRTMATDVREPAAAAAAAPAASAAVPAGKFLTFLLAGEEYGVAILAVQEIIGLLPITRVPRTPPFVRGVINLRGKIVPIVDLREKLGLGPAPLEAPGAGAPPGCIVVLETRGVKVGVVVDQVCDVVDVAAADVEPAPPLGGHVDTRFLLGIAKRPAEAQGQVRLLLDVDAALASPEAAELPN